ncbi:hypothetical protein SAMN05443574_11811 [Haloarcula vallismortis]|uniref:Uncharacterized protein n=2 Tax=Haloarcula vallismortis TaxID=28442 RepID=M0JJC5_HALVA|nr:hypothetical protein [Haloarcula vallismortis]EMA09101.1 hypothetical protein C437_07308 [Haloarcula vallismortis ATCC 29715]SDX19860.1 hypothetical protein SAMN05443574_11811 [Haloarcula vallismortis]
MSLAAATRDAVRERPFLYDALRAGVVNYTAAARTLDIDGEEDAIATALRRFAEELPADSAHDSDARVSMQSGLGRVESTDAESAIVLQIGDTAFAEDAGSLTGVVAAGDLASAALAEVLGRLRATDVAVKAAAVTDNALVVVVSRRAGPDALRIVEATVQK